MSRALNIYGVGIAYLAFLKYGHMLNYPSMKALINVYGIK